VWLLCRLGPPVRSKPCCRPTVPQRPFEACKREVCRRLMKLPIISTKVTILSLVGEVSPDGPGAQILRRTTRPPVRWHSREQYLLRGTARCRASRSRHAFGLVRQLLPLVQRHAVPPTPCVERHDASKLAVVLGLGDEPLHEHASAGGQRPHRCASRLAGCRGRLRGMWSNKPTVLSVGRASPSTRRCASRA
jgi:hypothetical protein